MKTGDKKLAWLAGISTLVVLWVVVSFWSYRHIEQAAEARKQAFTVLGGASELLSELRDAETGQRGYLLTGDEASLEPYLAARSNLGGHLEALRQRTRIQEARQAVATPVKETLAHGTIHGLANHALLLSRDGGECAIADSCAPIRDLDGKVVGAVLVFRDVTEENAAQQALRESEGEYRQLFESSRDALMVLMPPSWRFTDANQETLSLFGAPSKTAFTALGPADISPERQPDGRLSAEKAQAMIEGALREDSQAFEWEHRRMSGETFAASVSLPRMEARGLIWIQTTVRDMSERKRSEEALLKAGALQSANFSSIATDAKGVIQIFNVGAERMLGYATADVMNKITPADISDPQEVIARAKALSLELATTIRPGFASLVFKAEGPF